MSPHSPLFHRPRSLSSSSLSSDASDGYGPHSSARARRSRFDTMDRAHGRAFSQSTPELQHQHDGAGDSRDATGGAGMHAHPPRTHSHGAVASHFLAQPLDAYGGQTWMDFLRESGADPVPNVNAPQPNQFPRPLSEHLPQPSSSRFPPPPPRPPRPSESSSRSSADRKRRLTAAESPMRRPSSIRMHSGNAGDSSSNPIVLASPPAPSRPPPPPSYPSHTSTSSVRRDSDFRLPRWQPDSEVTHCFVCGSQFTFFYRKHHCRKCGRVVCNACSPHRITIPRQYIVHPPVDTHTIDLTADDDDNTMSTFGPFGNPALGGGEVVRVCNPCVPDPNYDPPPPPYDQASPYHRVSPAPRPPHIPGHGSLHRTHPRGHRTSQSVNDGSQTIGHGQTPRPRDPFTDRRVSFHGSTRVADLWPPPQPPHPSYMQPSAYDPRAGLHSRSGSNAFSPSQAQFDPAMPRRPFFPSRHPALVSAPLQPPPAPHRQIAEEDECPICGNELPPKGPNGDESVRTQHIEDCIALHSSSPLPAPSADQTSTSLPSQRTRGMSNAAGNGEGASNSNRLSMSARGMYPYTATEKDCVDEDGNQTECVICFEDYKPGDKMARLVCWCKFHEHCIRGWWDTKGRGACPTHQLQY